VSAPAAQLSPRRLTGGREGALRIGGLAAIVAIYLCLVGIVGTFNERPLVAGIMSLGQAALVLTALAAGFFGALRTGAGTRQKLIGGALAGAISGGAVSLFVLIGELVDLRAVLLQASPELYDLLTLGTGTDGFWLPTVAGAALGALGGATLAAAPSLRRSLIAGLLSLVVLGVFASLIRTPLLSSPLADFGRLLFSGDGGLTIIGAIVTLGGAVGNDLGARLGERLNARRAGQIGAMLGAALGGIVIGWIGGLIGGSMFAGGTQLVGSLGAAIGATGGIVSGALAGTGTRRLIHRGRVDERVAQLPEQQQRRVFIAGRVFLLALGLLLVLWLPIAVGPFFAQVVVLVALYVLMGLGLNITLGLAGLLDLGFVAFFAVGAYTVGLLTSTAEYGLLQWPFWAAVPFAVLFAMAFGAFLGLPILSIRGDYLAIATLGFGEIIRILAASNLMLPLLGGPRGIINIPKPLELPPSDPLAGPVQIYYVAIVCAAVIAFIAWRLRGSRLGRAWLAIREDEDVAEALGVNLVQTKLLAYMLGAAFAGLGGAVFAGLVGSIFPSSINFFVSINVAALIIVGGMGSIPGVVVGAIFLIGLPELFREFSEYRLLFYGIALIAVMRFRPEGLLPSRSVARELHIDANVGSVDTSDGTVATKISATAE